MSASQYSSRAGLGALEGSTLRWRGYLFGHGRLFLVAACPDGTELLLVFADTLYVDLPVVAYDIRLVAATAEDVRQIRRMLPRLAEYSSGPEPEEVFVAKAPEGRFVVWARGFHLMRNDEDDGAEWRQEVAAS